MNPDLTTKLSSPAIKTHHTILLYCCCGLLVVGFVHFYTLYTFLLNLFGKSFIASAPFILPLLLLSIIALLFWKWHIPVPNQSLKWHWIAGGFSLCLLALLIPDPNYAVKRIHVTEYLALSLLVRYTLSHHLKGGELLFFATMLSTLLGVHDELLQGLHPSRTFGLRDICVNSISALGGGCIWHGVGICRAAHTTDHFSKHHLLPTLYFLWLIISVVMMVVPFNYFKHSLIPTWVLLPLSASLVFWSSLRLVIHKNISHGVIVLSVFSFLLFFYPVIINVFQVPFN